MLFVKFLPDVLKELIKHVPTLMFELVDWSDLGREVPKITARILKKEGFHEFFANQKKFLTSAGIEISEESFSSSKTATPSIELGELILKYYFTQIYSPHGLSLDLRLQTIESTDENYRFHPTSLWTNFEPGFRNGLIHMYQGFYRKEDDLLEQGLIETGLLQPTWSDEKKEQLKAILKSHFGNSLEEGMKFELEHFKNSFVKLAVFLVENKVRISHDFMYLGIYLVSLYLGLETIRVPLSVSQIFHEVDQKLSGYSAS